MFRFTLFAFSILLGNSISYAGYDYLAAVSGPSSTSAGFCSQKPYSITRSNPTTGKPDTGGVSDNRTFTLSSNSSSMKFYSDSLCTKSITQAVILKGNSSVNFYAEDSKAESITIIATPVDLWWWEAGSMSVTEVSRVKVIQASATDSIGVSKVEFYVNGNLTCSVSNSPYNCSWNVPPGAGVQYQLYSKAYDSQGKTGKSSVVNVTSD